MDALPDEMLSEILGAVFEVPDHKFCDTSPTSPFATYSGESSSAALLVSKAWLRLSTPFLYNDVILRSKAQARALATALQGPQNLGRFVKKLRVEGGFGSHMHHILKCTPNVTDLFLSAMIHSPDTTTGLVLGLPLINPTRLILFEDPQDPLEKKRVLRLFAALEVGIRQKWTNLTTIVLENDDFAGVVRQNFEDAICTSKTLKIVSAPSISIRLLKKIAKIRSLQAIEMRATAESFESIYVDEIMAEPLLRRLMKFSKPPTPETETPVMYAIPTNPTFRPMETTPQAIVDKIWTCALFFAMVVDDTMGLPHTVKECANFDIDEYQSRVRTINRRRLSFLLVSKTLNRLALPYLYRYPILFGVRTVRRFAACLTANPAHSLHVREIYRKDPFNFSFEILKECQNYTPILSRTSHLIRLVTDGLEGFTLGWDAFEALAETAGKTLVEFTGFCVDASVSVVSQPTVFGHFTALRSLEWNSPVVFPVTVPGEDQSSAALPALEFLKVLSAGIFPALEQIDLPSLRRLVLGEEIDSPCTVFLRRHGFKLTDLQLNDRVLNGSSVSLFELCPSLSRLELHLLGPRLSSHEYPTPLVFPPKHLSLVHLVVYKQPIYFRHTETQTLAEWGRFLGGSNWTHFPALRDIRASPFAWPTDERGISRSPWVKCAEALWKFRHIKLTDRDGKHWRPRLK
ncbi:hypothetical protein C8R44DRAFT_691127 [Mycena epipterygia]|nr:hypothetical protein C8R44DRAFT_691127 [Mycena epipterygia]